MKTVRQVLESVAELKEAKSKDYQGGIFSEEEYFPHGQLSFNHMLWTKMLRLRSVTERDNNDEINYDSAEDTLRDLIAYAAMNLVWLQNSTPDIPPTSRQESAAEFHQHPADEYREKTIEELRGRRGRT